MASAAQLSALAILIGPAVTLTAHAEIYMSEAEAAKTIFPGQTFERMDIDLSDAEAEKIEKALGEKVRGKKLTAFRSLKKDYVFIDQALGKHEFITYAVGIDASGQVAGLEIIEYRESYGSAVRKPEWRAQFNGTTAAHPPKLGDQVKNLSGATLSSAHVTNGVKRVLQTYDVVRGRI